MSVGDLMAQAERDGTAPDRAPRPEGWTDAHEAIAQALYADTWTVEKAGDPDWHHRFPWWQCVQAARLLGDANLLPPFNGMSPEAGAGDSLSREGRNDVR